jgi:hypothetical protein
MKTVKQVKDEIVRRLADAENRPGGAYDKGERSGLAQALELLKETEPPEPKTDNFHRPEFGRDVPEVPFLDLAKYKTKAGAAKALARHLKRWAESVGYSPGEVFIWSPEERKERGEAPAWEVSFEAGPFEWAYKLTGGEKSCGVRWDGWKAERRTTWYMECSWSFAVTFWDL